MGYPLGPPIREEKVPEPEWKPYQGSKYILVNAKGELKNIRPPPPPKT